MANGQQTSSATSKSDDAYYQALGIGAAGCLGGLFIAKYVFPVLAGAVIGGFLYGTRYAGCRWRALQTYLLNLGSFCVLCVVLIGAPRTELAIGFDGVLAYWPGFWKFCGLTARWWNDHAPGLSLLKGLRVNSLKLEDIRRYLWLSIPIGIGFSVLYWGLSELRLRRRRKKAPREGGQVSRVSRPRAFAVASLPARAVLLSGYLLFWGWVRAAATTSRRLRGKGIAAHIAFLAVLYVPVLLAEYLWAFGAPKIPFADLRLVFRWAIFAPACGNFVGFILSKLLPTKALLQLGLDALAAPVPVVAQHLFELGRDHEKRPYCLTEKNLAYHVEMVAPSGSGKTNTLKNLLAHRIRIGHGVIFLDLKGEFDVVAWMYRATKFFGREKDLRLLSLANRELSVPYNPIKLGSASEIHSQIMSSLTWSEEFYRKIASVALMTLLRGLTEYRDKTGECFHLGHLYELLDRPGALRVLNEKLKATHCQAASDIEHLAEKLDRPTEKEKLMGLIAGLNQLLYSAAGPLMSTDVTRGSFDFREAIDHGRITYCLMNSLLLKESATVFGKMLLQDLMSFVGNRYAALDRKQPLRPVTLVIDEFASFATPEFIDFMDRARGAGIGIVLAHQARADLRKVSPEFQERIEANSNTTIVSGVKSSQDAEHYAGMVGTRKAKKETHQVEYSGLFGDRSTGMKSVREVEEYVVHPNELKRLDQGQAFVVSRTVDPGFALLQIPEADQFSQVEGSAAAVSGELSAIRASYLRGETERYLVLGVPTKPGLKREPEGKTDKGSAETKSSIWS